MTAPVVYVCGHGPRELERLERQGEIYGEITRSLLLSSGLALGMRVLDIGCGAGDVSLLAAEIVGPEGLVIGVDRAPEAVQAARARAAAAGLRQLEFRRASLDALVVEPKVDALVGRFVLMHQPDPARTLRLAADCVRPGGVIALIESDLVASLAGPHSQPRSAGYDRILRLMVSIIQRSGSHADVGLRLPAIFVAAGLPTPFAHVQARLEADQAAFVRRYLVESLRSMSASAAQLGIEGVSETAIAALAADLLAEDAAPRTLVAPLVVSAWCRLPEA